MYNTDYYLEKISKMSNRFGDKLLELMERNNKVKLIDITNIEAKEFYDYLIKEK